MKVQLKNSGQTYTLAQSDYIAGGGEGKVYQKGGFAFKIYHDPQKKGLPIGKLVELSQIKSDLVLGPKDILLDSKQNIIGFVMRYVTNTVFLCWLFNKGYKEQNNVTSDMLAALCSSMKNTTLALHKGGVVVGDYNEMNFLTENNYGRVLFIDVDSYQTAHYPCTAIMDTVRDRLVPFGTFNEETDWFGHAIVTFQLWTGIHPYKGKHKDYDRQMVKQLKLMDDNLSVFNSAVTLPKNALPLDVIPTALRRWYEGIFEHKDRSIPPDPGAVAAVLPTKVKIIQSHGNFVIEEVQKYTENILRVRVINGRTYVITKGAIYHDDRFLTFITSDSKYDLCEADGTYGPVAIKQHGGTISFHHIEGQKVTNVGQTTADDFFVTQNRCYTVNGRNVVLHRFVKQFDQLLHEEMTVEYVSSMTSTVFDGVVVMDVFGKFFFAIPYNRDYSRKANLPELDGHRIIHAKFIYDKVTPVLCIISEQGGDYHRTVVVFDSDMQIGVVRREDSNPNERANFTVVDSSGVCAMIVEDHTLELIKAAGVRKVDNPPFDSTVPLYTDGVKVLIANGAELSRVSLK